MQQRACQRKQQRRLERLAAAPTDAAGCLIKQPSERIREEHARRRRPRRLGAGGGKDSMRLAQHRNLRRAPLALISRWRRFCSVAGEQRRRRRSAASTHAAQRRPGRKALHSAQRHGGVSLRDNAGSHGTQHRGEDRIDGHHPQPRAPQRARRVVVQHAASMALSLLVLLQSFQLAFSQRAGRDSEDGARARVLQPVISARQSVDIERAEGPQRTLLAAGERQDGECDGGPQRTLILWRGRARGAGAVGRVGCAQQHRARAAARSGGNIAQPQRHRRH